MKFYRDEFANRIEYEIPLLKEIRTEVEALEKEIRLQRSILEVIQEPFFILDRKGDFLKVNPKGMEMLGYPPEELQQMVFIDVVALEDLSQGPEKGLRRWDKGKRFDSGPRSSVG